MQAPKIKPGAIADLPQENVKWIQARLAVGGYYKGTIDGLAGPKTVKALAQFKEDYYLQHPLMVGLSTLEALEDLTEPGKTTEQPINPTQQPNPDAGQKRGKKATLPLVGVVYEHQWMVEDGYMTWGEATKGLTRLPVGTNEHGSPETLIRNALTLARAIRSARHKFGGPIQYTSVYRPPAVNSAIGGARRSQHLKFLGSDMAPLDPTKWEYLLACLKATPEFKGIGIAGPRKGFWHGDCRVGDRVIFPYA